MALAFKHFLDAYPGGANRVFSPHKTCSLIMSSWQDCRQSAGLAASAVSAYACRRAPVPRQRGRRQREVWLEVESGPGATGLSLDLKGKTHSQSWHIAYSVRQIYLITTLQHALCGMLSGKKKIGLSCLYKAVLQSFSYPGAPCARLC